MNILTVCWGGDWKMKDGSNAYVGTLISKAFVIDINIGLDGAKDTIIQRFNLKTQAHEIELSHLNPFQKIQIPYIVETDEDFNCFIEINKLEKVQWSVPLYVTERKKKKTTKTTVVREKNSLVPFQNDYEMEGGSEVISCESRDKITEWGEIIEGDSPSYEDYTGFIHIGQIFDSKEMLKVAIRKVAMRENFVYKVYKSTPDLFTVKCADENCNWGLRAMVLKDTHFFEIRKYREEHTCSFEFRCENQCKPTYKMVGEQIKTRYEGVKTGPNPKSIRNDMRKEHCMDVSYWKALKAKEWAQNLIRGTPQENYGMLPIYCHMIKQVNIGTYTKLEVDDENCFKYVFIAVGATIRGFDQMRKVIMVDGTHLHTKYKGHLLIATAQDANQQIYPLAYAIVDSENDGSWTFFFQQLITVIPSSQELVIVSDRHLSIIKAVESIYTSSKHCVCRRHVHQNLKTRYKDRGVHKLFTLAANSYTKREFEENFKKICAINQEMGDYLVISKFEKWARSHCKGDRYNIMTTNNSETINKVLLEARSFQVVALLDCVLEMLIRWFVERRIKTEEALSKVVPPNIEEILQKRHKLSKKYEVRALNGFQYQVIGGDFYGVVDLEKRSCTCRVFDLDHIPCVHGMAAMQKAKVKVTGFVSDYYRFENWMKSYKETIYPVPRQTEEMIPEEIMNIQCLPPKLEKRTGKLKKKRIPSEGEFPNHSKRRCGPRRPARCSLYGSTGHNRTSCMNKTPEARSSPFVLE